MLLPADIVPSISTLTVRNQWGSSGMCSGTFTAPFTTISLMIWP